MLSRDRICNLAALSLFLSAIELFIPRFLPFFRLGLANIPLLMALSLDIRSFCVLALMKGIGTSYTAGNLFSIFSIISILQSLASGVTMLGLSRVLKKHISIYGISISGALVSTLVQLSLASLYAGSGAMAFMPAMLALSFPSALITAFISRKIVEPEYNPDIHGTGKHNGLNIALLAITGAAIMMTTALPLLLPALLLSFLLQHLAGRKIKLLPHITMLVFIVLSSLLVPEGEVLATIFSFPITEGALRDGLSRSLRLSGGIALSQAFSQLIKPERGIPGKTLTIFTMLLSSFRNAEGNIWQKFTSALTATNTEINPNTQINIPIFTLIAISSLIVILSIANCVFF